MGPVDPAFIVPPEHRPHSVNYDSLKGVPVLDMGALKSEDSQVIQNFIRALGDACREWGFFQVVNHGVTEEVIKNMQSKQRAFFALPATTKRAVSRTATNSRGFFDDELTKRTRDWKEGCVPRSSGCLPQAPRDWFPFP